MSNPSPSNYEYWSNKCVFITGATGIVGSWLTRTLLDAGAEVVALVRDYEPSSELIRSGTIQRCTVVNGELENIQVLERTLSHYECDTVFHLAAQTIVGTALRAPLLTFESNIRGTYNLLEACRRQRESIQRIVMASSDKAYGSSPTLPYDESMPLQGRHPYDVSKSCKDLISRAYFETYQLPLVIARCGNIYGGGDLNFSRLIPGTIKALWSHNTPQIRSNGKYTRDYVFIDDAVDAYLSMGQALDDMSHWGEAYNFGPQQPVSVLEVVSTLQRLMHCEDCHPEILDHADHEIEHQYLCAKKAKTQLGWEAKYSLEEGLQKTIDWYINFLEQKNKFSSSNHHLTNAK